MHTGKAHRRAAVRLEASGDVFFEHTVEVGAAEAEGAHARAPHLILLLLPGPQLGIDTERRVGKVDVGVFSLGVETRRQRLVMQRQGGFEHARRARCAFEMADVRLDRAERKRPHRQAVILEDLRQRLRLDHIADAGGGAVAFDHRGGVRDEAGVLPAALNGKLLPDGVRGGDAFTPPVARSAHAANNGIDRIAVAFGVGEAFEQEHGRSFPHHEAVGPFAVGPGAGSRERTDLAKLGERRGAHVGVGAAGDDGIVVVLGEPFDGRRNTSHGRGARRIDDVVRPVEIEQVGNAARDDVRQFAGHRVFGDLRDPLADAGLHFLQDGLLRLRGQRSEARRVFQFLGVFREEDAQGRQVMLVAPHGVAHDHGGAVRIEGPVGIAVVVERFAGGNDGPLLRAVHLVGHLGRDGQPPLHRLPVPVVAPSADLGIALVGGLGVRVVVKVRVPSVGADVGNAVASTC